MMKYKLELTKEQAQIVSEACELLARLKIGQFERIIDYTLDDIFWFESIDIDEFCNRRYKMEKYLQLAKEACYKKENPPLDTDKDVAWNIHQVLRHEVLGDERKPYAIVGELPKLEVIETEE